MESKIIMVTGGARSGKSGFAEKLCEAAGNSVGYIATATALDEGMVERIKRHQARRPDSWSTYEKQTALHELLSTQAIQAHDIILLDCLTVLTTNLMLADYSIDWDKVSRDWINELEANILLEIDKMLLTVRQSGLNIIIVTNEVGLGIVPENRLARVFRDIAGKVNEAVAKAAEEVYFVVSGIPMKIKG